MFVDRADAGSRLARAVLDAHVIDPDARAIVLGLPRGGVPVARVVADALGAELDVIVVRKLGAPGHSEYAIGAIGPGGIRFLDTGAAAAVGADDASIAEIEQRETEELLRREARYRADRPALRLEGRVVIIVDDGVATGATAGTACRAARALGAGSVILAVPVAPADWATRLGDAADAYVAVETPRDFWAVGQHYRDFTQTTDGEVTDALQ